MELVLPRCIGITQESGGSKNTRSEYILFRCVIMLCYNRIALLRVKDNNKATASKQTVAASRVPTNFANHLN